jgi:hypothetical protein
MRKISRGDRPVAPTTAHYNSPRLRPAIDEKKQKGFILSQE